MKPRYLEADNRGRDRWMVSYVDVLTILLIFFICAAIKVAKAPTPVASAARSAVPAAPAAPPPAAPAAPPSQPVLDELQRHLEADGIDVRREARGMVVSLPQAILFASGDDRISNDARPIVARIASSIRDLPNHVTLVGFADNLPVSNRRFHSNWDLAAARSLRLLDLLVRDYGVSESRLSISSEGANRPKSSNETAEGRADNRRVEIVIADES